MRFVLDASFLLQMVDQRSAPLSDEVFSRLLHRHVALAPGLLAWELGNAVFGSRLLPKEVEEDTRSEVLERLLKYVSLETTDPAARSRTGQLARTQGLTFYGASYLELAARDDSTLLATLDRRLRLAAQRLLGPRRALDGPQLAALLAPAEA